jgi:hypothetical protein
MVLNINGMKFERAGRYSIDLAIDNRHDKENKQNAWGALDLWRRSRSTRQK